MYQLTNYQLPTSQQHVKKNKLFVIEKMTRTTGKEEVCMGHNSSYALGCMAIRTQTELMIRRVQFIRRTKEAATQAACAGNSRGYHSEYGNSWFNNRENDDAYYMFRSYNNCYYSSSEPITEEEDEL